MHYTWTETLIINTSATDRVIGTHQRTYVVPASSFRVVPGDYSNLALFPQQRPNMLRKSVKNASENSLIIHVNRKEVVVHNATNNDVIPVNTLVSRDSSGLAIPITAFTSSTSDDDVHTHHKNNLLGVAFYTKESGVSVVHVDVNHHSLHIVPLNVTDTQFNNIKVGDGLALEVINDSGVYKATGKLVVDNTKPTIAKVVSKLAWPQKHALVRLLTVLA